MFNETTQNKGRGGISSQIEDVQPNARNQHTENDSNDSSIYSLNELNSQNLFLEIY